MKGVNSVVLLGRLGNDPELKQVGQGTSVATFSLATSEVWTDREGQKQEKTEWHRVVVWGKLAEVAAKYLSKGSSCYVQGKLSTRSWQTESGEKKYSTEIVAKDLQFLSAKNNDDSGGGSSRPKASSKKQESSYDDNDGYEPDFDDNGDIPF